jgi:hypothetical protein
MEEQRRYWHSKAFNTQNAYGATEGHHARTIYSHSLALFARSRNPVEPGYNDIALYNISPIESYILWYQLIRHC